MNKLANIKRRDFLQYAGIGSLALLASPDALFSAIGGPALAAGWKSLSAGYLDEGWKDTVLLMPSERVRLLLRFKDYAGLFAYHRHMLEHGDSGLMRNYRVEV